MDVQGEGIYHDDDRTPDHQTTCENSAMRFYLVKLQEFRNPNLVAAQDLLHHQRVILETRREKSVYKDQLCLSLYCSSCNKENRKRMMEDLRVLQVSLDKLTFANKRSLIKPIGPNTSSEEIDNLGLHFGMLHGSNNLANERKILKKTQLTRRKTNPLMTLEDYDRRIRKLRCSFLSGRHASAMEKQRILMEIPEMKLAKEAAIQSAVCKGEMWESLGDKDGIQERMKLSLIREDRKCLMLGYRFSGNLITRHHLQIMQEDINASRGEHLEINAEAAVALRELEAADKDLARLDKQLSVIDEIMGGAYKCFLQWRNEHQQANVCYNQSVSLLNDARKLAEEKDMASLRSLCDQQTALFMEKWNNDGDFRDDYKRRATVSLNLRGLCSDGRTRNPNEVPITAGDQTVKLSRRLFKVVKEIESVVRMNPREMEGRLRQGNRIYRR